MQEGHILLSVSLKTGKKISPVKVELHVFGGRRTPYC